MPAGIERFSHTSAHTSAFADSSGRAAVTPRARTRASGSGSRASNASTAAASYSPSAARRTSTRHARSKLSAAAASRTSKCPGSVAAAARVRRAGARSSGSSARVAATSASRPSWVGTATAGLHCSAALSDMARNGSTTPGLRSLRSTPSTQVSSSSVDSSPLRSMSHAVETASARDSASGRAEADSSIVRSDRSSVRTAAKVRSWWLSR